MTQFFFSPLEDSFCFAFNTSNSREIFYLRKLYSDSFPGPCVTTERSHWLGDSRRRPSRVSQPVTLLWGLVGWALGSQGPDCCAASGSQDRFGTGTRRIIPLLAVRVSSIGVLTRTRRSICTSVSCQSTWTNPNGFEAGKLCTTFWVDATGRLSFVMEWGVKCYVLIKFLSF